MPIRLGLAGKSTAAAVRLFFIPSRGGRTWDKSEDAKVPFAATPLVRTSSGLSTRCDYHRIARGGSGMSSWIKVTVVLHSLEPPRFGLRHSYSNALIAVYKVRRVCTSRYFGFELYTAASTTGDCCVQHVYFVVSRRCSCTATMARGSSRAHRRDNENLMRDTAVKSRSVRRRRKCYCLHLLENEKCG